MTIKCRKSRKPRKRIVRIPVNYRDTSWRLPKLDMSILGEPKVRKP